MAGEQPVLEKELIKLRLVVFRVSSFVGTSHENTLLKNAQIDHLQTGDVYVCLQYVITCCRHVLVRAKDIKL